MSLGTYLCGHDHVMQILGFGTHLFICCCCMHRFWNPFLHLLLLHAHYMISSGCCWYSYIYEDLFTSLFSHSWLSLSPEYVFQRDHLLQDSCRMSYSYFSSWMQARMSRAILLMRILVNEESRWRLTGMVSEKLLFDLSINFFASSMKKTRFFVCDYAGTNKK